MDEYDFPELSGTTISERDKAFAKEFADFVNGSMSSPDQTGRELTKAHRYLQQQMFKVFLGFMSSWHTTISREDTMTATSGHHGCPQKPINGSLSVT